MAKQRTEINAFTRGIVGSPSETDIPQDAASYSVNIDPNSEDGTLRSIKEDYILDKSGFVASAQAVETLTIKRTHNTTDNGTTTYNYSGVWFDIVFPNDEKIYIWFDTTGSETDPVVAAERDDEYISGYEVRIDNTHTIEQIRDLIEAAIPTAITGDNSLAKEDVSTNAIKLTSGLYGDTNLIQFASYSGASATATITVTSNTLSDHNGDTFTVTSNGDTNSTHKFKFDSSTTDDSGVVAQTEIISASENRDFASASDWVVYSAGGTADPALGDDGSPAYLEVTGSTATGAQGVQLSNSYLATITAGRKYIVSAKIWTADDEGIEGFKISLGGILTSSFNISTDETAKTFEFSNAGMTDGPIIIYYENASTSQWFVDDVSIKEISDEIIIGISGLSASTTVIAAQIEDTINNYYALNSSDNNEFAITAERPAGSSIVTLTQVTSGSQGNVTIVETVSGAGDGTTIAGFTGGRGAFNSSEDEGVILTVDDLTRPGDHTAWQASQSHVNITGNSNGSGTGLTCNIVTDGSGHTTFTIVTGGTGYVVDEQITFTDPGTEVSPNTAVLIVNTFTSKVISKTINTVGTGTVFPINDFTLINNGSATNTKTIYDAIGIDYDTNKIYKYPDIYSNELDSPVSSLGILAEGIEHNNESVFTTRNKATHIGLGNTQDSTTQWTGFIDTKQLDETLNDYYVVPDKLESLAGSLAPIDLDYIMSFPFSNSSSKGRNNLFSAQQTFHADIPNDLGSQTLNHHMHTNSSGKLYEKGDGSYSDNWNVQSNGKTNDSIPRIGWCFRITTTTDTSDGKLTEAKHRFFDSSQGAIAGDIFQVVDPGTDASSSDAEVNYIGNLLDADPDGLSCKNGFVYGMIDGGTHIYRISTTLTADTSAFDTTNGSVSGQRWTKYDIKDIVGESGIATMAFCMTAITSGHSAENSKYLTYGDGTIDGDALSMQNCRGLHQFLWISNNDGKLFRVNIVDLDDLHTSDEEYKGIILDEQMDFDYSNIARCSSSSDTNKFDKWFGPVYQATKAKFYEGTKSGYDTNEYQHNVNGAYTGNDWASNYNWDREPSNVKIIGICETHVNRRAGEVTLGNTNNKDYVFELDNNNSGYDDIVHNGKAHKWGGNTDYSVTTACKAEVNEHGFDCGQVVTFYNTSDGNLDSNMKGNTIVLRPIDHNHVYVGGDRDGKGADDKVGVYTSKVWILFGKKSDTTPFSRWQLFLYNFTPNTVTSTGDALMYDRTPPYVELGINKWEGTGGKPSGRADEYRDQNSSFKVGIDKESVLWYDGQDEDSGWRDHDGSFVGSNHSWSTTSEEHLRKYIYKRRDGTVVGKTVGGTDSLSQHQQGWGANSGWYGDGTSNVRKVLPQAHTLQPYAVSTSKHYAQSVNFIAKVKGKFSTRQGMSWRHQTGSTDHMLHIGNKWETFSNDFTLFSINDNASAIKSNDTRLWGMKHQEGDGTSEYWFQGDTGDSSRLPKAKDETGSNGSGIVNRASHYYYGGRFKNNTNLGGNTSFSTYDGTKMVPSTVPYSNTTSGNTYYQGQVGDYLFIDRKWLSTDPDINNAFFLNSNHERIEIYESEGDNNHMYTKFSNNVRLGSGTSNTGDSTLSGSQAITTGLHNEMFGDEESSSHEKGYIYADFGNNEYHSDLGFTDYNYHRSVLSRQSTWMVIGSQGDSSSSRRGPYSWDIRTWSPAFSSLHYQSCRMRKFNMPGSKWDKIRFGQTYNISAINYTDHPDYPSGSTDRILEKNGRHGSRDQLYFVSAVTESSSNDESSIQVYCPSSYTTGKNHKIQKSYDWAIRNYAYFACANKLDIHTYKKYSDVPKLIPHSTGWAASDWVKDSDDSPIDMRYFIATGLSTPADETNTQFIIRSDSGANSFKWNWDAGGLSKGYSRQGEFSSFPASSSFVTEADSFITIVNGETGSSGEFPASSSVRYKCSLLYDGFQESPLSTFYWDRKMGGTAYDSMDINIKISDVSVLNPRITHILIYRRVGEDTLYRLVKEVPLEEEWEVNDAGEYIYSFRDSRRSGSYEAMTGISESVDDTSLNYTIACEINDELFAGNCYTPVIENGDARRYIFKSRPGNYSQFNLNKDYLILPTIPTALAAFNGRVYAFDRSNTYVINPDGMYVEDTYQGVGCLSQHAFSVSEYGMCFADTNNVYLHDGTKPVQIANNITKIRTLEGFKIGYQHAVKNTEDSPNFEKPRIFWDGKANSFVVFLQGTCTTSCDNTVSRAFAYNIARNRWDYWVAPLCKQAVQGQDNDILITDNKYLYNYKNSSTDRLWEFRSKQLSLAQLGNNKRFHRIKTYGAPTMTTISSTADPLNDNIVVFVDGVPQNLSLENIRYDKSYTGAKLYTNMTDSSTTVLLNPVTADAPITGSDVIARGKLPEPGSYLMIEDEIVKVTARSTTTLTVTRSQLGTTAVTHGGAEVGGNIRLYYIAPSIKLPSNCKGKKIEVHLKAQNGIIDGIGIEYINKGNS